MNDEPITIKNFAEKLEETETYERYHNQVITYNKRLYKVRIDYFDDDNILRVRLVDIATGEPFEDRYSKVSGEDEFNSMIDLARKIKAELIDEVVTDAEENE